MPNLLGDKPIPGRINNLLTNNVYILNLIVVIIIYFSVKGIENQEQLLHHKLKKTFLIWILYLVYIKFQMQWV